MFSPPAVARVATNLNPLERFPKIRSTIENQDATKRKRNLANNHLFLNGIIVERQ